MPGELKTARRKVRDDIRAALSNASADVLGYDPTDLPNPPTLTISTAQVLPTEYAFLAKVYVPAGQSEGAQDLLDDLVSDVEDTLSDEYPRSEWGWEFDEQKGEYVMQGLVRVGREDF